ncbi:MAG: 4-hydroxythreonine-4-phosphate dehydrogenase PdxA [Planctomycetota bacterium]|nr:4-hydroxythreonine-4-phosphate dehydrogenase PdxA [Planctomycetota bacterium]
MSDAAWDPAVDAPVLALSLGDPAGIGPEIVLRYAEALEKGGSPACRLLVVGDPAALERDRRLIEGAPALPVVEGPEALRQAGLAVGVFGGARALERLPAYGAVDAGAGAASHAWVVEAADLALAGRVAGVVTAPVNKAAWHAGGVTVPGHTEVLQQRAGVPRVLMLLVGGRLRTALATVHVPLADVPALVTTEELVARLELLARTIADGFGPDVPRLAVCGLNPHAGEEGLFGREDLDVIRPAVEAARERGIDAHGPLPADACIPAAAQGAYDAVLAMYHDQALPAVKTIAPREAVNVTLGLPFVRTSVDHGTAFDIAGRGIASDSSLAAAVRLAGEMVGRRAQRGIAGI